MTEIDALKERICWLEREVQEKEEIRVYLVEKIAEQDELIESLEALTGAIGLSLPDKVAEDLRIREMPTTRSTP